MHDNTRTSSLAAQAEHAAALQLLARLYCFPGKVGGVEKHQFGGC
jgi:hypothetical protein